MPDTLPAHRLVIKETRRANLKARAVVSILIMLAVGAMVAFQEAMGLQSFADPRVASMVGLAVVLLGGASLLAWHRAGEYEFLERVADRILVRTTKTSTPVFDAPLENVRFQKLVLPGGASQLFLRDGVRAVEIGSDLTPPEMEGFQAKVEQFLGKQALVR